MIHVSHETAEGRLCSVEVYEGTLGDKLRRGRLIQDSIKRQRNQTEARDVITAFIEVHTFPSCLACSRSLSDSEHEDAPLDVMTFEQFCGLPDQFVELWAEAVFKLNPGWRDDGAFPQVRPPEKSK